MDQLPVDALLNMCTFLVPFQHSSLIRKPCQIEVWKDLLLFNNKELFEGVQSIFCLSVLNRSLYETMSQDEPCKSMWRCLLVVIKRNIRCATELQDTDEWCPSVHDMRTICSRAYERRLYGEPFLSDISYELQHANFNHSVSKILAILLSKKGLRALSCDGVDVDLLQMLFESRPNHLATVQLFNLLQTLSSQMDITKPFELYSMAKDCRVLTNILLLGYPSKDYMSILTTTFPSKVVLDLIFEAEKLSDGKVSVPKLLGSLPPLDRRSLQNQYMQYKKEREKLQP